MESQNKKLKSKVPPEETNSDDDESDSCDCNKTDEDLVDLSRGQEIEVIDAEMPAAMRDFAVQAIAKTLVDKGCKTFVDIAIKLNELLGERFEGSWCCAVGKDGKFDVFGDSRESTRMRAFAGKLDIQMYMQAS